MTTATGQTLQMNYDVLRRLSSVSSDLYTKQYTYKDYSDRTTGLVSQVQYTGLPTSLAFGYTYDALGNIATYTAPDGEVITYVYDEMGQLRRAVGDQTYTYTYDSAGNIRSANGHTYEYDDASWKDLLTAFDGETITYDASGNPLSYYNGTRYTFTWKDGRNLATASSASGSVSFEYDSDGLRTKKTVTGEGTHYYFYAGGQLLRESYNGNFLDFSYDANGYPYAMKYNGTTYYCITNLQGDVVAILDGSGNAVAEYLYNAWGVPVLTAFDSGSTDLYSVNPLRYRGYIYDDGTYLYYLQSRYYDPIIGRFISADNYPSTGQGLTGNNMFAYCGNNPVSREDESGEFWLTAVIISAVVAGVISAAADAAIQVATTGEVDPGQVLIAGVSGAISGACALIPGGALATTAISVGVNAALNAGSYVVNQLRKGEAIDKKDFWVNVGIGAISGAAGNLFRFGSTGAIRNAGEKLVNKGMQKITNGVMNSATSTIKRGFQYIDRGISMIYQYAARAGVNSGFGSTTGCVINGIYSLVG